METMKYSCGYTVGSGYHCKPTQPYDKFFPIWWDNLMRHASPRPTNVVILANGVGPRPAEKRGLWIDLPGNLGHVHDLNNHRKPYDFSGWTMTFLIGAQLAYANETDFIFVEQDALAFGPWVERMYREIGAAGMIFGSSKQFDSVQSLVLCKHWFIPEFVHLCLGSGSQQMKENENESKFARLKKAWPDKFAQLSFGYDRDRPFDVNQPVFYLQQIKGDEMRQLVAAGLLPADTPILENSWAPNVGVGDLSTAI